MSKAVTKLRVKYQPGHEPDVLIPTSYKNYRFLLGRCGKNPLVCIGMNPSAARDEYSDRTVNKVIKLAYQNGYDGWIMLNIYPQRATNAAIHLSTNVNNRLNFNNLEIIKKYITENKIKEIWGAWGDIDAKRPWLTTVKTQIVQMVQSLGCRIFYFGALTKKYHNPPHPLYLVVDFTKKKYL